MSKSWTTHFDLYMCILFCELSFTGCENSSAIRRSESQSKVGCANVSSFFKVLKDTYSLIQVSSLYTDTSR